MLAFIPFLCPFDDIIIGVVIGILGVIGYFKGRKACIKKPCDCSCHPQKKK